MHLTAPDARPRGVAPQSGDESLVLVGDDVLHAPEAALRELREYARPTLALSLTPTQQTSCSLCSSAETPMTHSIAVERTCPSRRACS